MTTFIIPRTRDKRAYRLRCRFKIEPYPSVGRLEREKVIIAEKFVVDMRKQGWENDGRFGFKMKGPFSMVVPTTIRPRRMPTAREMLPGVRNGNRFLDNGETGVTLVRTLHESEWWEYEIAGVFLREQILTERPDAHEEELR